MTAFETGRLLGRIPFLRIGAGPPVVVLYGGQALFQPLDRAGRRHARRVAGLMPAGRTLLVLGYPAEPPADYSLDTLAADVAAIMRAETGPAPVVGISFGGFIALRLAAARPDLVQRLALLVSAHRFSAEGRRRIERQIAFLERDDAYGLMADFAGVFRRPWLALLLRLRLWTGRRRLAARLNAPAAIIRGLQLPLDAQEEEAPARLGRIAAPTLILGGTADPFFTVEDMRATAALIPGARLELFAGEGHM
ncbi:MAG TPA: alpha/beta fold hydrolase, partial [Alphaproteobacteria bacterium]|nr:alpha/beta fold hydrolase [Alphaproteobacteria bacterium]